MYSNVCTGFCAKTSDNIPHDRIRSASEIRLIEPGLGLFVLVRREVVSEVQFMRSLPLLQGRLPKIGLGLH